jgi:hypothetical protein
MEVGEEVSFLICNLCERLVLFEVRRAVMSWVVITYDKWKDGGKVERWDVGFKGFTPPATFKVALDRVVMNIS